ncbi:MAG: metal-dependent hydrolase, partial [Candidatus Nanohaloarchaea archaeon]
MAGHAFLAFTLVTVAARLLDVDVRHALVLGVTAALFAVLPDVDMVYAWTEIAAVFTTGLSGFVDAFWTASQATHRGISHSLVTAVIGATGFSLLYTGRDAAAAATFTGLLAGAFVFGGLLPLGVMAVFIAAGVGITGFLRKNTGLSGAAFFAAALAGLGSHPFGDVFTGQPPTFLHPMDIPVLTERAVLHPDPVINLLSVFFLELGTVVAGTALFLALTGRPVRDHVHPVAGLGLLYGAAVVIVPAPTL